MNIPTVDNVRAPSDKTDVDNRKGITKLPSLSFRSNVAALLVLIPFIAMAVIQLHVSKNVLESRELLIKKDIPIAINSLSMLEELGDMNANMLKYVLGNQEEKTAYRENLDEYNAFFKMIPEDKPIIPILKRVNRLVKDTTNTANSKVFSYDPLSQDQTQQKANEISNLYAWPLFELFERIKHEEAADELCRQESADEIQLLHSQYQLKLIMTALQRHAYNDLEAQYQFFDEFLQLEHGVEGYLEKQKDTLPESSVVEIMRLLSEIRSQGTELLEEYDVRKFMLATATIGEIEHYNYAVSEELLTDVTEYARSNIQDSVRNLNKVIDEANLINQLTALAGCIFLAMYLFHVRSSYLRPIAWIAGMINSMRKTEKGINFENNFNSREVHDIASSLKAFDMQLNELEELRNSQRLEEQENHRLEQAKAYAELADRERKQRETANELREVNNDLEQFVHIASHDLREPLKKMSVFAQMLEMQLGDKVDDNSRELLDIIHDNAFSMANLIDDLRSLTRIYDSTLEIEQCNLENIVNTLLSKHTKALQECNASIYISTLPAVPAYLNLMKQVFDNLIRNALAHGDNKLLLIEISSEPHENGHTVSFTNSSTQTVHAPQKLLQPFIKGKATGGTGMGLAICKKIIDVHSGSISVDTSVEQRFTVRLFLKNHFEKKQKHEVSTSEHN